jgi:hypothetical protein
MSRLYCRNRRKPDASKVTYRYFVAIILLNGILMQRCREWYPDAALSRALPHGVPLIFLAGGTKYANCRICAYPASQPGEKNCPDAITCANT